MGLLLVAALMSAVATASLRVRHAVPHFAGPVSFRLGRPVAPLTVVAPLTLAGSA